MKTFAELASSYIQAERESVKAQETADVARNSAAQLRDELMQRIIRSETENPAGDSDRAYIAAGYVFLVDSPSDVPRLVILPIASELP